MEQRIIDLVHSILCKKPHTHNVDDLILPRKPDTCYYYLEGQVEHGENMEDHLHYLEETTTISQLLGIQSDSEMIRFLNSLLKIAGSVAVMEHEWPKTKEILKRLLDV